MKKQKRVIALLLIAVMLFTALPAAALTANGTEELTEEVVYNLLNQEVTVYTDAPDEDAFTFAKDGSFTIELERDAYFPYEVQFTCAGEKTTCWFMNAEDSVKVGGHTFYVHSESTDPYALHQFGAWIGEDYIPAYPAEKTFTDDADMISTYSLLPLERRSLQLNMDGYFPEQLKVVTLDTIIGKVNGSQKPASADNIVAWAKWYYYDEDGNYISENDDYTVLNAENKTINLLDSYYYYDSFNTYKRTVTLELIVGTLDQLNLNNVRYEINVTMPHIADYLEFTLYNKANPREKIEICRTRHYDNSNYYLYTDKQPWKEGEQAYLSMKLKDVVPATVTATVYQGLYREADSIPENAKDITAQVWNQQNMATEGGYLANYSSNYPEFTVVLEQNGEILMVYPFRIIMREASLSLGTNGVYGQNDGGSRTSIWRSSRFSNNYLVYQIKEGYPLTGRYFIGLSMNSDAVHSSDYGREFVEKAVVGTYRKATDIPKDAKNIADELFSDPYSKGYLADFSKEVAFTIVDVEGNVWNEKLKLERYVEQSATITASSDTYFRVNGANKTGSGAYAAYVMPYNADSYYYNGYQTVMLLNSDGTPVTDGKIVPVFWSSDTSTVHAGHGGVSGIKQTSGETELSFAPGEAIQYSAAAEDGQNLKNYWVTFLTKHVGGPKLFVNGENVTVEDKESGDQIVQRELFLTDEYGNHHDVFFANLGDTAMTGMYAYLTDDTQNVAIDEYWSIGATTTLSPFTTTCENYYSELKNIGKIRLVPEEIDYPDDGIAHGGSSKWKFGEISGTLVIGYGDKDNPTEEVRIKLTGVAGTPKITTTSVIDGVKYVPYSSVIQTNNMKASDAISFKVTSGKLPDGVKIKPNGELYGVPTKAGQYTFTVMAVYNGDETISDSKEFTLTVLDNTNENVEATNIGIHGYPLLDRIPDTLDVTQISADGEVFRSEGVYSDFVAFYLDGRKLTEGRDYTSESGSTKITIQAQTFRNAGNGTHTLSAEFRTNANADGEMKSTAQNVKISGASHSGGSGGSVSSTPTVTVQPTTGGKLTVSPEKATAGTTVTVTVTPDEGYILESLTGSNGLELTKISETQYTFVMPKNSVALTAQFVDVREKTGLLFVDVRPGDWFFEAVKYMYENSLMAGMREDLFAPDGTTTREQAVTVLWRMAGKPDAPAAQFKDVMQNSWYSSAVNWAFSTQVVSGYTDDVFGVEGTITREEFVTILYRYAKLKNCDVSATVDLASFSDSGMISGYAVEAIMWANAEGILCGTTETTIDPGKEITRAQIAAILMRFCENIAE